MAQLTVRTSEALVDRVRTAAQQSGRSMNEYVADVLEAATDPDLAGDEAARIRERLVRAGIVAPAGTPRVRPSAERVAAARVAAGRKTPLSTIVSSDRS